MLYYMELAAPLLDVLKKGNAKTIQWTPAMTSSFSHLKNALCQDVVIHDPDFNHPFILQTDASNVTIGAVLTQCDQGTERPIAYSSHKLLPVETWYATTE